MKTLPLSEKQFEALREYGIDSDEVRACTLCRFESGEVLIRQGVPVNSLYLMLKGQIKVCMLAANGKDLTLSYYISSGLLGDVELVLSDRTASATSIAVVLTECIQIPMLPNEPYLMQNIAFMTCIARGLSLKLLNRGDEHISSALYSGEERLCSYILMMQHNGVFAETLSEASKSIGISYRHLFRLLNRLCQNGTLKKESAGFVILNRQYLQKKAARSEVVQG